MSQPLSEGHYSTEQDVSDLSKSERLTPLNSPPVKLSICEDEIPDLSTFDEKPEAKLFDSIHNKLLVLKYFRKWACYFLNILRSEKMRNEELEKQSMEGLINLSQFRKFQRQQLNKDIRKSIVDALNIRKTAMYFDKWVRRKEQMDLSNSSLIQDEFRDLDDKAVMGRLHNLIRNISELSNKSEVLSQQINDVQIVINKTQHKVKKTNEMVDKSNEKYIKTLNQVNKMEDQYKAEIANLQISINNIKEVIQDTLKEKKRRLNQKIQAKEVKKEELLNSHKYMKQKKSEILEKIQDQKEIALRTRRDFIMNTKLIDEVTYELTNLESTRDKSKTVYETLKPTINNTVDDSLEVEYKNVKKQLNELKGAFNYNQYLIKENNNVILKLSAALNVIKEQYNKAHEAEELED